MFTILSLFSPHTCSVQKLRNKRVYKRLSAKRDARPFTCGNTRFKDALGNIYMHLKPRREGWGERAAVEKDYY